MELKKKAYAISLWQPWASLIVIGAKRYETRGWDTSYRGPLVIHAARRFTIDERQICLSHPFRDVLAGAGISHTRQLPFGAFLCIVDLVEIVPTREVINFLSKQEIAFGNYLPNRFAWKLENVRRFPEPIPGRGYQKLWTPVEELEVQSDG